MPAKKKKNACSPESDSFGILKLGDISYVPKSYDISETYNRVYDSRLGSLFGESSALDPKPDPKSTAKEVAAWMLKEVKTKQALSQKHAACHIMRYFGERFVGQNVNGNMAISPKVLDEFLLISEKTVVWNRRAPYWRLRQPSDPISRRVDD